MAAIDQIIEWAQSLPGWKSDAVRRILVQEKLTPRDEMDILAMLKEAFGLRDSTNPAPTPNPVQRGMVSGAPQLKIRITLKTLKDLKNINAIPNGSYIPFSEEGLTVIYGENGSGKSGYARVLKKACSARDTNEQIHPNVFSEVVSSPASAAVTIGIEGRADENILWADGGEKNDMLANIVVFDSKSARVIVDDENDVSFRPYGAHVFDGLIELLDKLRDHLQREKPEALMLRWVNVSSDTSAGRFLETITADTSLGALDAAISWTEDNVERLSQLKARISIAESPDRAAKIRGLKANHMLLTDLSKELNRMTTALQDATEQRLFQKLDELKTAEEALLVIAKQSVGSEPLPGVGEKAWQTLYLAAKEYAMHYAYPGQDFPSHNEIERCVLCMQKLDKDARARFVRFKEFMEQSAKKKAETILYEIRMILEPMRSLNFSLFDRQTPFGQEILARSTPEVVQAIESYQSTMKQRVAYLIGLGERKPVEKVPLPKSSPFEDVLNIAKTIDREREEAEKGENPAELQAIKAECLELEARKEINSRRSEIISHIEILKKRRKYDEAIAATHIGGVSSMSKRIISEAITPSLQIALASELENLGAQLPLGMKPTRSDGEVVHKLVLTRGSLPRRALLTSILSEGEQRVVAIAGFLAELTASGETNPIVFDDPVCSLDHKFREKVAERLVKEAMKRQVIIFTHDIAFLVSLQSHADRLEATMSEQTIRYKDQAPGFSAKGVPWHAMSVSERLEHLLSKKVPRIVPLQAQDPEKYNEEAANIYGKLRESWEACVEETLFNRVIRRHSSEIQILRLSGVQVSPERYREFFFNFDKCCEWMTGHDKSKALDVNRPSPAEIRADIEALRNFQREVTRESRELANARQELVRRITPPLEQRS